MAIVYAIRQARLPKATERRKLRFQVRPVLRGRLGRVLAGFALAGVGIGCAETAEHAAVAAFAPAELRGSAFGLLATVQAIGNVAAGVVAGLLYTLTSPTVAFGYLAVWMLIALAVLSWAARNEDRQPRS